MKGPCQGQGLDRGLNSAPKHPHERTFMLSLHFDKVRRPGLGHEDAQTSWMDGRTRADTEQLKHWHGKCSAYTACKATALP